jgi:hypothetical protein
MTGRGFASKDRRVTRRRVTPQQEKTLPSNQSSIPQKTELSLGVEEGREREKRRRRREEWVVSANSSHSPHLGALTNPPGDPRRSRVNITVRRR